MHLDLKGLVAATFTALRPDGEIHLDQIERQAEALVSRGAVGAFVCGTTGEGQSLSSDERRRVLERWCAVAGAKLKIIAHVGHVSLPEARALAAHAAASGAVAIGAMPPYFFKSQNLDDILICASQVASAAPQLPFYYYHFPAMSGVSISASELLHKGVERIPNLAGLKFTDDNLMEFERCIAVAGGKMDLFLGREGMMLAGHCIGGRAAIGSAINFAAPIFRRLIKAFETGDLAAARQAQARANAMLAIFVRFGGLRAQKAAMNMVGPDCGPLRPPLRALNERELAAMRAELEAIGFFDLTRPG
ncbi:MAG TPA: dihydrodipicolinate synthase family protein [Tepidisphaeraceae bacterium]|nr:dihydrodipicolinate synthase family protein [Tepidisphaeraceae bacterium]